jgi:tetratricopeptide (TPR) repeat protein
LINLATVHEQAGSPKEAISLLYRAMNLIDADSDPRLLLCARHNLITNLANAERLMEAQRVLIETQPLYRRFPENSVQSRLKWVQAKISRGLGRHKEAEELFLAAREGFLGAGLPHDAALLTLELAALYSEQGRSAELRRLTEQVRPFFESNKIQHETLVVLMAL